MREKFPQKIETEEEKENRERGQYWKEKVIGKQKPKNPNRPAEMSKKEWEEYKKKERNKEQRKVLERKVFGK